jgi:hypothetical protein
MIPATRSASPTNCRSSLAATKVPEVPAPVEPADPGVVEPFAGRRRQPVGHDHVRRLSQLLRLGRRRRESLLSRNDDLP